jgi:hypothetical protein
MSRRILRLFGSAVVGSAAGGVLFVLGWATRADADVPAFHGFLSFLTPHILGGGNALQRGMVLALLAGAVGGAVVSVLVTIAGARSSVGGGRDRRGRL